MMMVGHSHSRRRPDDRPRSRSTSATRDRPPPSRRRGEVNSRRLDNSPSRYTRDDYDRRPAAYRDRSDRDATESLPRRRSPSPYDERRGYKWKMSDYDDVSNHKSHHLENGFRGSRRDRISRYDDVDRDDTDHEEDRRRSRSDRREIRKLPGTDWEERVSTSKKIFFYNTVTGVSQWDPPKELLVDSSPRHRDVLRDDNRPRRTSRSPLQESSRSHHRRHVDPGGSEEEGEDLRDEPRRPTLRSTIHNTRSESSHRSGNHHRQMSASPPQVYNHRSTQRTANNHHHTYEHHRRHDEPPSVTRRLKYDDRRRSRSPSIPNRDSRSPQPRKRDEIISRYSPPSRYAREIRDDTERRLLAYRDRSDRRDRSESLPRRRTSPSNIEERRSCRRRATPDRSYKSQMENGTREPRRERRRYDDVDGRGGVEDMDIEDEHRKSRSPSEDSRKRRRQDRSSPTPTKNEHPSPSSSSNTNLSHNHQQLNQQTLSPSQVTMDNLEQIIESLADTPELPDLRKLSREDALKTIRSVLTIMRDASRGGINRTPTNDPRGSPVKSRKYGQSSSHKESVNGGNATSGVLINRSNLTIPSPVGSEISEYSSYGRSPSDSGVDIAVPQRNAPLSTTLTNNFREDSIKHVTNWPSDRVEREANRLAEDSHAIGSINCTRVSAELKMARSLVRLTEIQATLQEQRIMFLRQQIKEVEEWRSQQVPAFGH